MQFEEDHPLWGPFVWLGAILACLAVTAFPVLGIVYWLSGDAGWSLVAGFAMAVLTVGWLYRLTSGKDRAPKPAEVNTRFGRVIWVLTRFEDDNPVFGPYVWLGAVLACLGVAAVPAVALVYLVSGDAGWSLVAGVAAAAVMAWWLFRLTSSGVAR